MADRLLIDVDADGHMSVSSMRPNDDLPQMVAGPIRLDRPLGDDEMEDLRWYLERYLTVPFGVYEDRGTKIADRLPTWGAALFSAVFGAGKARDAYVALRQRATSPGVAEIVVRSQAPEWLALPWELLRDPDRPNPLALDGIRITRSLPAAHLGEAFAVGGQRLRVLMVISRPLGTGDVGYQMIARPLLRRLAAVRGKVEIVVLRPPTLEALQSELRTARNAGEPYQIVHFDGHGSGTGAPDRYEHSGHGVLVFEKPGGGADHVPADRIAQVLAEAQVPVVVLNACQSGAVDKELEAAVATRLLAGGAAAVVAMAYSVYAVAAAEFMTAFYEHLFTGDSVGEAVRAGRARMKLRPDRPSPKGKLPLADWLVPVHYRRHEVHFPDLQAQARPDLSLDDALDRLRNPTAAESDDDLAAVGEFVGRDALFYTLEQAARTHRVVLLHGPAGTGKTEAAKAFGRWWRDTRGVDRPDLVIVHSFKPGVATFGLDGVIAAIGGRAFGPKFALVTDRDKRRELIHQLLNEHRLLLIWDNFEPVASMPDPGAATPPLDAVGQRELADFLTRVAAGGRSAILITSRTPEPWLDAAPIRRIELGGLDRPDAIDYADILLESFPAAAPRRADRAFERLMDWLDGHPLCMRVMLPHLDTTDARTILNRLHGTTPLPEGDGDNLLAASLTYSLSHLDPANRDLLVAVCLFDGVVDADVLGQFSHHEHLPSRFCGLDSNAWKAVLDNAAYVGLLTPLGAGMYAIHPALPAHLAAQWHADHPAQYLSERTIADRALLDAYSAFAYWMFGQIQGGDAAMAFRVVQFQRRTLGRMLGHALETGLWVHAHAIALPLDEYWTREGLIDEARHWTDRARKALEGLDKGPPGLDQPAGALWLFLTSAQAKRAGAAGRLDSAAAAYTDIHTMLLAQPDSHINRRRLADSAHQLGVVAQLRGRLDEAEQWYHQCLTIKEELGNRPAKGPTFHQLGIIAQLRGQLDEAEQWYHQSLTINEELGNQPNMASTYHQLGMLAELRGRLDEAEQWYHQSLTIKEELGNRPGMAGTHHQLGVVAQLRGRLDEAEQWYHQSLTINEELGDQPSMASSYHQLGRVAELRGRLDEAEQWYHQSLTLEEELGNRPGTADSYHQLGVVAQLRGRLDEAEQWYHQSLTINEELGNQPNMAGTYHQLGMLAELRGRLDEAEQWYYQSLTINEELGNRPGMAMTYGQLGMLAEESHDDVGAMRWTVRCVSLFDKFPHSATGPGPMHLARLTHKFGIATLREQWEQITGKPVPAAVEKFIENWESDD